MPSYKYVGSARLPSYVKRRPVTFRDLKHATFKKKLIDRSARKINTFVAKRFRRRRFRRQNPFAPEKKLLAIQDRNERPTVAIQTGAIASYRGFVMGTKPTAWTGTWDNNMGMVIPKGDDENQRNGQYVYLKHSNVFLNIDSKQASNGCVCELRTIVFRARRAVNPTGVYYNPSTSLFLSDTGAPIGHETADINGTDLMFRMLNKRDFIIKHDQRFCLSPVFVPDNDGGAVRYSGNYPVYKNFRFKLPYNKKTRYGTNDLPEDCAYHWGIIIYCRSIGKDTSTVNQIEFNIRGNTVFLDP